MLCIFFQPAGLKGKWLENPDELGKIPRTSSDFQGFIAQKVLQPLENFQAEARGITYRWLSEWSGTWTSGSLSRPLPALENTHTHTEGLGHIGTGLRLHLKMGPQVRIRKAPEGPEAMQRHGHLRRWTRHQVSKAKDRQSHASVTA